MMAAEAPSSSGSGSAARGGRIRRLDEAVVNRIAAGEIIQRPANAIKEMIENSLDAGSTKIAITVKSGGLKSLVIHDNGHGINFDDLGIVCERHTTSKLTSFEDLRQIATFGFRGEALASISHVAHVTITTRTKDSKCAYKASYSDGKPVPPKPGQSADPKPCAGNVGTQILVEDLFYNVTTRRKALSNHNEEHNRLSLVVSQYAIHNSGVAFTLKKHGSPKADLNTAVGASKIDNIRAVYGSSVANELLEIEHEDEKLSLKVSGYVSNANYSMKRGTMLLFINERLVQSTSIKKALEVVYAAYLPKGSHPFMYLSLRMKPQNVDVNVHPTKREVHFLHEDAIVEQIQKTIEAKLLGANSSRTFYTQTLLPGVSSGARTTGSGVAAGLSLKRRSQAAMSAAEGDEAGAASSDSQRTLKKARTRTSTGDGPRVYDHDLVRTDSKAQKLDAFLLRGEAAEAAKQRDADRLQSEIAKGKQKAALAMDEDGDGDWDPIRNCYRKRTKERTPVVPVVTLDAHMLDAAPAASPGASAEATIALEPSLPSVVKAQVAWDQSNTPLTSVHELRQTILDSEHALLRDLFGKHKFVGVVDRRAALVQFQTKLYIVRVQTVCQEFFYQLALRGFGSHRPITFKVPPSLFRLLLNALDRPDSGWTEEDGPKEDLAEHMVAFLKSKGPMLSEYYGISIDEEGRLVGLPLLLDKHVPRMRFLPTFLLRLATEVEWDSEKECFDSLAREIGAFYREFEVSRTGTSEDGPAEDKGDTDAAWILENVIFASLRQMFAPPRPMAEDMTVCQVADLHELYKVFERC